MALYYFDKSTKNLLESWQSLGGRGNRQDSEEVNKNFEKKYK